MHRRLAGLVSLAYFRSVPNPAGYSGTPLPKKLGITPGASVVVIGPPDDYADLVSPLPMGARIVARMPKEPEFVHVFATKRAELAKHLGKLRPTLVPNGTIWVSWPKKASGVATDITEDVIRAVALPLGFVDVKVCAVDETWSGLKLVIRLELRSGGKSKAATTSARKR
jgi:hypothetical protein